MKGLGLWGERGKNTQNQQQNKTRKSTSIFQKSLWGAHTKGIFFTLLDNIYLLKPCSNIESNTRKLPLYSTFKKRLHQKTFRNLSRDWHQAKTSLFVFWNYIHVSKAWNWGKRKAPPTPKTLNCICKNTPNLYNNEIHLLFILFAVFMCHYKNYLCALFRFASLPSKKKKICIKL